MFQYFVKIVPTTYVKLNEEVSADEYVCAIRKQQFSQFYPETKTAFETHLFMFDDFAKMVYWEKDIS